MSKLFSFTLILFLSACATSNNVSTTEEDKPVYCNKAGTMVTVGTRWCRNGKWEKCNKRGRWTRTGEDCKD